MEKVKGEEEAKEKWKVRTSRLSLRARYRGNFFENLFHNFLVFWKEMRKRLTIQILQLTYLHFLIYNKDTVLYHTNVVEATIY